VGCNAVESGRKVPISWRNMLSCIFRVVYFSTLEMELAGYTKVLVTFYHTTWQHIPEASNLILRIVCRNRKNIEWRSHVTSDVKSNMSNFLINSEYVSSRCTGRQGLQGCERLRFPHFETFGSQMVARLSALRAGRFLPPGTFLVLILLEAESTPGW
jgi:hypothetical protein